MAGISEQSLDPKRTIVVLNFPPNVGGDDLTIHFQKARHGGGDVDDVVVDGSVAFVTFDSPEVAKSVLNHEQIIDDSNVQTQSYESWLAKKKSNAPVDNQDGDDGIATIYVSGIGSSTTDESITLFFENKKRTRGGDLCEGKQGIERVAPNVARLSFVSSKDAQNVLQKSQEEPLRLAGNLLNLSTAFEATHDRSILLAKNLNPQTNIETFTNFVQFKRNVNVYNVVLGKEGKAIVILNGEADLNEEFANESMELDGSTISLEFAPLTKRVRVCNIPAGTSKDDVMYKFQSRTPGRQVKNVELDEKRRVADVYFENSSVVSELVKKEHKHRSVKLIVYPYHNDFEELEEVTTKTAEFSVNCQLDPRVMEYILLYGAIDVFDFKSMKYDKVNSRIYYTKDFDHSFRAEEFKEKVSGFLGTFSIEEVKIPTGIFEKVQKAVQDKCERFGGKKIVRCFEDHRVTFVGKKEDVSWIRQKAEEIIDKVSEEAKLESIELKIEDQNKLKFLNFVDYFNKLKKEFPEMKTLDTSGKLTLLVSAEKAKDIELRIWKDLMNIWEIDVNLSSHQLEFLRRTDCQLVNDLLKNDDVMLTLVNSKNSLQAKILSLTKFHDNEMKRFHDVVLARTSEKWIKVDDETAEFLAKSEELQKVKKEQFDKHQVLIKEELTSPCKFWIVCAQSKISNVENDLIVLVKKKKIGTSKFTPADPMKIRFFEEHCWEKIKEKETSCNVEGVVIEKIESDSLKVKGTNAGRKEVITFLETLAEKVELKVFPLTRPGMKKQTSMEATKAIICLIEKEHRCVIKTENIQPEGEIHEDATDTRHGAVPVGKRATTNLPSSTNPPSMSFVNDKEVKMCSGQRITIVVGDLAMQKVDVIVNTTNASVDLNANACGKALLKIAGDQLMKECKEIGSLKAGDMASTGPGNLNCKRVYHVRSSPWDSGRGALILRKLIQKCLNQVEKDKYTSIAIPGIGTGNLHFPRSEVANVFFNEVRDYLIAHPRSPINDIRFVAYSGDQQTVDAFLGAVQNIKSTDLPPSTIYKQNTSLTEKPDGSLQLSIGRKNLTVQIVCADITKERTDVIMHVITQDFKFQGGVIKALAKAGGDDIVRECKALGKPAIFSTQYTTAGKLAAGQIAHVIAPDSCKVHDLKRCLDVFLDDIIKRNIAKVSFSAIGAGAMGLPEREVVGMIFDNLFRVAETKNSKLSLVRIVIMDKEKFGKFKDATKTYYNYVLAASATSSSSQPVVKSATKELQIMHGRTIKIYSDDRGKIDRAWGELEDKMGRNIEEMTMNDDDIKKFTDHHLKELSKLSHDFDVNIVPDVGQGTVKIKGHIADVSNIQEKIRTMLKKISDEENKVPDYWDNSLTGGVHKVNLSTGSKEYKEIEIAFKKTAPNQLIVRIDRIQNRDIYVLYNVKRQAMKKKYGKNFSGKELMLFHGTSVENIDKINSGGLNRNFAGIHATHFGRGVYFARDASYSCKKIFSPEDSQGHRYMYYAKVLVGEFTVGTQSMIVAPNKNTADPNETYDSVVDDVKKPGIYVMFQDYEYYTEYLITFK